MADESAHARAKRLELAIVALWAGVDMIELEPAVRKLVAEIKHGAGDVRLDARAYDYADTRAEQTREAAAAKKRLLALRNNIVAVSQHGTPGPVEVAELSANIDTLIEQLA